MSKEAVKRKRPLTAGLVSECLRVRPHTASELVDNTGRSLDSIQTALKKHLRVKVVEVRREGGRPPTSVWGFITGDELLDLFRRSDNEEGV